MLSYTSGKPIAKDGNRIIYIKTEEDNNLDFDDSFDSSDELTEIDTDNILEPLLDMEKRTTAYIAGPAGSGKSSFAIMLIKRFMKVYPDRPFYLFSRTHYSSDPVFKGMKVNQIMVDQSIIDDPIDITKEMNTGCIILFDDCNTIQDDKLRKAVEKIMCDVLECGRRLEIYCIITNHLIIPNEKKMGRTILNESQSLTVFPKSGSSQQITYSLKQYFGLSKDQIETILQLPSRWVMIHKQYPMYVVHQHGIYIL